MTSPSYSDVAQYSPASQTWHPVANMLSARSYMGVAAAVDEADGEEYLFAIAGMDDRFSPSATVERYSVAKDEWTNYDALPVGEGAVVAGLLSNSTRQELLVAGGMYAFSHTV